MLHANRDGWDFIIADIVSLYLTHLPREAIVHVALQYYHFFGGK